MDFTKMFMDCINFNVIDQMSDEELDAVSAIFDKSDMYNNITGTEDDE